MGDSEISGLGEVIPALAWTYNLQENFTVFFFGFFLIFYYFQESKLSLDQSHHRTESDFPWPGVHGQNVASLNSMQCFDNFPRAGDGTRCGGGKGSVYLMSVGGTRPGSVCPLRLCTSDI